jgi:hypothetical protein
MTRLSRVVHDGFCENTTRKSMATLHVENIPEDVYEIARKIRENQPPSAVAHESTEEMLRADRAR